jgi:hypothetical protein
MEGVRHISAYKLFIKPQLLLGVGISDIFQVGQRTEEQSYCPKVGRGASGVIIGASWLKKGQEEQVFDRLEHRDSIGAVM